MKTESYLIGYSIGRLIASRELLMKILDDFFPQGVSPFIIAEIYELEDLDKLDNLWKKAVSFIRKPDRADLFIKEMEVLLPDIKELILGYNSDLSAQSKWRQDMEKRKNGKLVLLNLVMDYPVNWTRFKVLRDFVQNFYDSIGFEQWTKRFSWRQTGNSTVMRAENVEFDYQWLVHIGASTKREQPGKYAGKFGEGFKIASLAGFRDYKWNITMSSCDWRIYVTSSDFCIDGQHMESLAYYVEKVPHTNYSELVISGGVPIHEDLLISVIQSFYYKENPLLGEPIWESERAAIYKRSDLEVPYQIPYTPGIKKRGIVFSAYQALGSVDIPLVFCNHFSGENDRDRNSLLDFQVISLIDKVVWDISDPHVAITVLEYLKNHWHAYRSKKIEYSFYSIINRLVEIVDSNKCAKTLFLARYPDLLVVDKLKRGDYGGSYRRKLSRAWASSANRKYKFVQSAFKILGYQTVEQACQQNGGFLEFQPASELEKQLVAILERYARQIFGDFFGFVDYPAVDIIANSSAKWLGMANLVPVTRCRYNDFGMRIRYGLRSVALKKNLFSCDKYGQAWSTYIHELSHVFGGDQSAGFSRALSVTMDMCMNCIDRMSLMRAEWQKVFGASV
ncbi:MAG: hypothetical protein ACQETH_15580 [Candidatus Rifleibacteriota bacterium]